MYKLSLLALRAGLEPTAFTDRKNPEWAHWLVRFGSVLGTVLFLAGIIYFFAYNWNGLPAWQKFTLVEGAFVACLVGVWKSAQAPFRRQLFICTASVFVGVFLAVFGQVYQTGANAWQMFAAWAGLISVWTVLSRFAAQWALLLVLFNIALFFYSWNAGLGTVLIPRAMALNAAALLARELALAQGAQWLRARWVGVLPLIPLLTATSFALCQWLLEGYSRAEYNLTALAGLICLTALLGFFYRQRDMVRLALCLCAGFPIVISALLFFMPGSLFSEMMFFLLGLVTLGYAAIAGRIVYGLRHEPDDEFAEKRTLSEDTEPSTLVPATTSPHGTETNPDSVAGNSLLTESNLSSTAPTVPTSAPPEPTAARNLQKLVKSQAGKYAATAVYALGSLLGTCFFLFAMFGIYWTEEVVLGVGLMLVTVSVLVSYIKGAHQAELTALSLGPLLTGLGLCSFGISSLWSIYTMLVVMTVISGAVYALVSHALPRFWVTLLWAETMLRMRFGAIGHDVRLGIDTPLLVPMLVGMALPLLFTVPLLVLASGHRWPRALMPAMYAGICVLAGSLISYVLIPDFMLIELFGFGQTQQILCWVFGFTLLVLLWMELRQTIVPQSAPRRQVYVHMGIATALVLGLVWLNAAGVLLVLVLLAVGHGRSLTGMTVLGVLFLPCFLFQFYYTLHTTLLLKSLILSGSGLLLLAGAGYVYATERRAKPCAH